MRIGIDLVEIPRIRKSLELKGFLERVFSPEERLMLKKRKDMAQSAAACFAAKEAFSKAVGTGLVGFSLRDVSVLRDGLGAPYIKLSARAGELYGGEKIFVSLTHTKDTAAAVVIIE